MVLFLSWCPRWMPSWCAWATSRRRWSGIAAAGGVWRGISRPAARRSSRWVWRWPGSMRRAVVYFEKEQAGALKATDMYVFRVAAMLDDFAVDGSVLRRYSRSVEQAERRAGRRPRCVSGVAAGGWLRGLDGPSLWHSRWGVPRVYCESGRAGRAGRRGDRRVRRDAGGLCAEDGGAQAVRGAVASAVRRSRRAYRPGCARDGPGGQVDQAGCGVSEPLIERPHFLPQR